MNQQKSKMENINIEIIKTDGIFLKENSHMIIIPCIEGDIGVLADHISLVSVIRPGYIKIYDNAEKITKEIFIHGGFVEISNNNVSILADEAILKQDINFDEIKEDLEKNKNLLLDSDNLSLISDLESKIKIAESIIVE